MKQFKVYDLIIYKNRNGDIVLGQNVGTLSEGTVTISPDQVDLVVKQLRSLGTLVDRVNGTVTLLETEVGRVRG